jgi:hypothetical protein
MEDYCHRTDAGHISMGFQPVNPVTFDIKNTVLSGLKTSWNYLVLICYLSFMCLYV